MTQLQVSNVAVEFGATTLLQDVTFTVARGERWGVIGRNGTGKTTLFRLITGTLAPTRGQVIRMPGLRVAELEQNREFGGAATVWEAAAGQFAELLRLERSLADQADALAAAGESSDDAMLARYARDLERFEREGGYTFAPRVDAVLHGLGFDPQRARTQPLAELSGGERGRVGLARQLAAPADLLLLDEPTNHLDLETTTWLERYLRDSDETVLVVSHDRAFLENVVDHVVHLEAKSAQTYVGGFASFVAQRAERRLAQERAFAKQRKVIEKEEDYIRRNIAGQNSKQAKGRRKRLVRLPRLGPPPGTPGSMTLRLETAERGGDQVIVAERVRIEVGSGNGDGPAGDGDARHGAGPGPGEPRLLLDQFTARVERGEVVGLVGPNGAGKTTLLRALVGERPPQGGALRVGISTSVAYYDQSLSRVPLDRTLYDIIADLRPLWTRGQVQGHLGRFGFSGDEVHRPAGTLSGGERARVALAMIELQRANLLVFDEPTNHLDVESIEALEDALESYDGTVLLVSHDRALLRALVTRTWVLHGTRITDFPGSFEEWEQVSRERAHAAAVQAAEVESLRRAKERQRTQRRDSARDDGRGALRQARTRVAETETRAAAAEAAVGALTGALEDPSLYATPEGVKRAATLGADLDAAKRTLDQALAAWTSAMEELERLERA